MPQTRSKATQALRQAQAQLWLLSPGFPGPATDAMLAALPCTAKRCLRATCRAARDAVDARICGICVPYGDLAPLPAAAPRLQQLQRLECWFEAAGDYAAFLVALPLLPPSLVELRLWDCAGGDEEDQPAPQLEAIAAALAARSALRRLGIACFNNAAHGERLLGAAAQLPHLEDFGVEMNDFNFLLDWSEATPLLELPWRQLQSLSLGGGASHMLPQLLARRDVPALRALQVAGGPPLDLAPLWAAPWLSQLTRLDVACDEDEFDFLAGAPPALPALQELRAGLSSGRVPLAAVRRLAAMQLPALRRLELHGLAPGGVTALAAAPWLSSLQALSLEDCRNFYFLGSAAAAAAAAAATAAAALAAAPLGALTRLELAGLNLVLRAAPLPALLAAPWAASLRHLHVDAVRSTEPDNGAAWRALVAARLPALRSLELHYMRVGDAPRFFASAPWLPQLEKLALCHDELTARAAAALAACDLPRLHALELAAVRLRGCALAALSAAAWLPRLQRLCLSGAVDEDGFSAVERGDCGLRELREHGGQVDAFGLRLVL